MSKFKTIAEGNTAIGAVEYRATSNGEKVNLQEWHASNRGYKTVASCTAEEFQEFADDFGLFDGYTCKASCLKKIIGCLEEFA